ncbi:hypothetical protein [Rubrolithibacter danxiaensis]|uniref:hypothetical protein n=1 Tax=Rubrolithibacter danxiaensis TaxID=3390805 RepID=UPI003BF888A4
MKNLNKLLVLLFLVSFSFSCKKDEGGSIIDDDKSVILQGSITEDMTLEANKNYILKGQVFVKNNATLTIPAGVTVAAEQAASAAEKAALIVTKGSKLLVSGTAEQPVVFTSGATSKAPGDWTGIIILGNAPTNLPEAHIKGIESSTDTEFGGDVPADNSGTIQYLRLEYCGGLNPGQEEEWEIDMASGLSLEGVGSGTTLEHVMVKNSLDDGFQFVGGTVNGRYLIALDNGDDNFDFDRGYTGKLQFLISYRRAFGNHAIRANGLESLNDKDASNIQPFTKPVISNITIIGPEGMDNNENNHSQGIYIRKNTRFNIMNSIVAGYSDGGLMLCPRTKPLLINNEGSEFKFNLVNCDDPAKSFAYDTGGNGENIIADPQVAAYATEMETASIERPSVNKNIIIDPIADLKLKATYSADVPDLSPQEGSPALTGADFTDNDFSTFFEKVTFRGATGAENWAASSNWAAWN